MPNELPSRRGQDDVAQHDDVVVRDLRRELMALEAQLGQRELELATTRAELSVFANLYRAQLGDLEAELADIEAKIAAAMSSLEPTDPELSRNAEQAQKRADRAKDDAGARDSLEVRVLPNEELKALFREVARTVHPDLARDESEVALRQHLMAEANAAYARGDAAGLRAILDQWNRRTTRAATSMEPEAEVLRTTIARVKARLLTLENEILQLQTSALMQLMTSVGRAERQGRDLVAEMRTTLAGRVQHARERLIAVQREAGI